MSGDCSGLQWACFWKKETRNLIGSYCVKNINYWITGEYGLFSSKHRLKEIRKSGYQLERRYIALDGYLKDEFVNQEEEATADSQRRHSEIWETLIYVLGSRKILPDGNNWKSGETVMWYMIYCFERGGEERQGYLIVEWSDIKKSGQWS